MSLEEEFSKDGKSVEISDEEAANITTVGLAVNWLKENGIEDQPDPVGSSEP